MPRGHRVPQLQSSRARASRVRQTFVNPMAQASAPRSAHLEGRWDLDRAHTTNQLSHTQPAANKNCGMGICCPGHQASVVTGFESSFVFMAGNCQHVIVHNRGDRLRVVRALPGMQGRDLSTKTLHSHYQHTRVVPAGCIYIDYM